MIAVAGDRAIYLVGISLAPELSKVEMPLTSEVLLLSWCIQCEFDTGRSSTSSWCALSEDSSRPRLLGDQQRADAMTKCPCSARTAALAESLWPGAPPDQGYDFAPEAGAVAVVCDGVAIGKAAANSR